MLKINNFLNDPLNKRFIEYLIELLQNNKFVFKKLLKYMYLGQNKLDTISLNIKKNVDFIDIKQNIVSVYENLYVNIY